MKSSRIRDGTCVSCIGRQILYHWATREAPRGIFKPCHGSPMGGRVPAERWECASSLSLVFLLCQGTSQKEVSEAQFRTTCVESSALDPTWRPRGLLLNLTVKGHVWTQKPFLIKIGLLFGSGWGRSEVKMMLAHVLKMNLKKTKMNLDPLPQSIPKNQLQMG